MLGEPVPWDVPWPVLGDVVWPELWPEPLEVAVPVAGAACDVAVVDAAGLEL